MKLIVKIPLVIGVVVLAASIGIGAISIHISSGVLERSILDGIGDGNKANAELLEAFVDGQLGVIGEIANSSEIRTLDWEIMRPALIQDIGRIGALDMAVISMEGISHYALEAVDVDVSDRGYFRRAIAGEKNAEVVFSRVIGRIVVVMAVPIFRDNHPGSPVIGALIARKDGGSTLSNLVTGLRNSHASAYSYLTDMNGTFIAHRNTDLVTSQFNPVQAAESDPSLRPLADLGLIPKQRLPVYCRKDRKGKQ